MPPSFLHGTETIEVDGGLRPIRTVRSSVIFIADTAPDADDAIWPVGVHKVIAGRRNELAGLGATGGLPAALDGILDQAGAVIVAVRVAEGADANETRSNIIGGIDNATGAYTGLHAALSAENTTGLKPRIIIAPGHSSATAVATEMQAIAERLRGVAIIDGPNTNDDDAIAYRGEFGSDRVFLVDPWVTVYDTVADAEVVEPASARVAGLIAKMDDERGFWWSPSNQTINGITGTARDVDFGLSDANARANLLNEQEVATIIRKDGYRLWGNRSTSSDPQWAFLSVRRTADMIYESIEEQHLWAMDRPFSEQLLLDIREGLAAYLRSLEVRGAILGSDIWLDPELNTEAALKAGQLYVDFDIEPAGPLERLTFRAHRNGDYYEELVAQVAAAA